MASLNDFELDEQTDDEPEEISWMSDREKVFAARVTLRLRDVEQSVSREFREKIENRILDVAGDSKDHCIFT